MCEYGELDLLTGRNTGGSSGNKFIAGSEETYHFPSRRYKMISQFTWPNFPTGNAEEGTKVLLEDRKLVKDVTFGKTKIFVRTPATLFELERAR